MAFENSDECETVIGRDREIAALVKLWRRQPGPIAINLAAPDIAAQNPDHIAVTVIGPAIAILVHRAAEFGENNNDGVAPRLPQFSCQDG